jgi:hypothetical protein
LAEVSHEGTGCDEASHWLHSESSGVFKLLVQLTQLWDLVCAKGQETLEL